jgi:hypothetical protein
LCGCVICGAESIVEVADQSGLSSEELKTVEVWFWPKLDV